MRLTDFHTTSALTSSGRTGVVFEDIETLYTEHKWAILPVGRGEKFPHIKWGKYQTEQPSKKVTQAWFNDGHVGGAWIICQASGVAVLDVDSEPAHEYWKSLIPNELERTPRVITGKGFHYYFSVPEELRGKPELKDRLHQNNTGKPSIDDWDFRGEGGIVIPPTYHVKSAKKYAWDRENMRPCPADGPCAFTSVTVLLEIFAKQVVRTTGHDRKSSDDFQLDKAIADFQQTGDGGGRNTIFKDIAMSTVRKVKGDQTFAESILRPIFDGLHDKTGFSWEEDCLKAIASAVKTYHKDTLAPAATHATTHGISGKPALPSGPDTGYLTPSSNNTLLVDIVVGPNAPKGSPGVGLLTNFTMTAKGVIVDDQLDKTYVVDIFTKKGDIHLDVSLPVEEMASPASFSAFLLKFNCYLYNVDKMVGNFTLAARFDMFLSSQDPPRYHGTEYLGVQKQGDHGEFVCHEGVITDEGLQPHSSIMPSPMLRGSHFAPYKYQFEGSMREALVSFAEVATLHDFVTTSVYVSRFAALLHKADLMDNGGIGFFPICGVEAPSGSGKTSGFFGFMNELSGCTVPPTIATAAAIRYRMASHRNVDIFIDDKNMPKREAADVHEIFRTATAEGTVLKIDSTTNNSGIEKVLMGSALHAGEGLGIRSEKALLDRYLLLRLTRPEGRPTVRRDKRNGELQENDVQEMRTRSLGRYSGWLVQRAMAVRRTPLALRDQLLSLSGSSSQRQGAKMQTVRYGARVFMEMIAPLREGASWCKEIIDAGADLVLDGLLERVDAWCAQQDAEYDPNANALDSFLSEALSELYDNEAPLPAENGRPPTPMFVASSKLWEGESVIHFRFDYLISWYKMRHTFEADARVRNQSALMQQLEQSYAGQWKQSQTIAFKKTDANKKAVARWFVLSPEATDRLFKQAELDPPQRRMIYA